MKTIDKLLIAYALMVPVTYGPAFVSVEADVVVSCEQFRKERPAEKWYSTCAEFAVGQAVFGGGASAILWPLYWSVQAAEAAR